jgi:MFS family permease
MSQTIPSEGPLSGGSNHSTDGRRLGLTLGLLVLPMYVALGAPSVALPDIGRALAVPFGATAWILAAWSLTSALAMPVAGRLLARWSPFQVLVVGVVTLAAGSALAGAGPTLPVVIAGRLIGGAGAGATVIAVYAAATALPRRERIRTLGIIAAAGATASGSGTLLGGAVTALAGLARRARHPGPRTTPPAGRPAEQARVDAEERRRDSTSSAQPCCRCSPAR